MKILQKCSQRYVIFLVMMVAAVLVEAADTHNMHNSADNNVKISGGWIRLTPPVAKNSAAYFVVHNTATVDIQIVGVSTPVAETATMHNTSIEQSMARMIHLEELNIPAGGEVEFVSGGMHLMLVNLQKQLKANMEIPVIFELSTGEKLKTKFIVKAERDAHLSHGHGTHGKPI